MPISGPSSYPSVCQLFHSHWGSVDTALGAPLVLAGFLIRSTTPVNRVAFKGWYDELMAQRTLVEESLVAVELARGAFTDLRTELAVRVLQFNKAVRGNAPGTRYDRSLPDAPNEFTNAADFLSAVTRVRSLWVALNADASLAIGGPLLLEGGFAVAGFAGLYQGVAGLQARQEALADAMAHLRLERESRNDLQDRLYELLKGYRQVVATKFPAGHAILDAMPVLSPAPGSTPPAVTITATWDAATQMARVEVQGAVPAGVASLQVRGLPGVDYDSDDESVLGSIPLGGPLVFSTASFLGAVGLSAVFKVYTMTALGHEAGSNAAVVTRV